MFHRSITNTSRRTNLINGLISREGVRLYNTANKPLPINTIIKFVPQQMAYIVERAGKFNTILTGGVAFLIPFLDQIAYVKSLKEVAVSIPSQSAITSDNVTLSLNGVLYYKVIDAYKASYGIENAELATSLLAETSMRSEIGQMTLDRVLGERSILNAKIVLAMNLSTEPWGIKCLRCNTEL